MAIYDKLMAPRYEFYEGPEKVFIDAGPQGTGKTWTANAWAINHNHNNISFFNTHALIDELYHNISRFGGLNGQIDFIPNINVLFGKNFILSDKQQKTYIYPQCLCSLYTNSYLFDLRSKGFLVSDFCKKRCPDRHSCLYREHKQEALRAYKIKTNNICMLPKAFIHTGVIDGFTNKFDNLIAIIDENTFNLLFDQKDFYPSRIDDYIDLVNDIIRRNNELKEIWNPLEDILLLIRNYTKAKKNLKVERKITEVTNRIINFINSLGKNPILKLDTWNESIKQTFVKYKRDIENTYNLLKPFTEVMKDVVRLKKVGETVSEFFAIDDRRNVFSYVINRITRIKNLINMFHKTIFNDATTTRVLFEDLFPEFKDNYSFFSRKDLKSPWKRVYTLNKYHAEMSSRKYGVYPKYSLIKKYTKPDEKPYKESYYKLVGITKNILEKEYNNGRTKLLILAFKVFIKELKKNLKFTINKLNLDVSYDYWYNLEGKNSYKDCEYGISFGAAGHPSQIINIFSNMFGVDKKTLRWHSTQLQMIQGAERIRPQLYRNQKIWYNLSNAVSGLFSNEVNLPEIDQSQLIEYLKQMSWSNQTNIANFLNTSTTSVGKTLKQLQKDNLIKTRKISSGKGRPMTVYKYIGIN